MSNPGFRKGRSQGGRGTASRDGAEGFVSSSLFSQAQILHLMKTEFARSRRHGLPLGCLLMQVDRMQPLVDLYGADLRATLRQTLGTMVREKTRGADLLGLFQEDRYMLVLPHTALEQTRIVAERLQRMFRDYEVAVGGRQLDLTLSIGFSATGQSDAMFFDTLVGQSEAALDFALEHGGNRIVSFGETQLLDSDPQPEPES